MKTFHLEHQKDLRKEGYKWIFYSIATTPERSLRAVVAAQIVQDLVRVLAAAAQGALELNKKEGGITRWTFYLVRNMTPKCQQHVRVPAVV